MSKKTDQVLTHLTLANTVEVISETIKALAGEDISNRLNGETLTNDILTETIAVSLQSEFATLLN